MTTEEKARAYAEKELVRAISRPAHPLDHRAPYFDSKDVQQAYLAGATEALASQWVSVEDRLPKRGEDVLIYTKKGQIKMSCWEGAKDIDDNESRHRHWKWWGNLCPYVLCWMPLPIPPLKGDSDTFNETDK